MQMISAFNIKHKAAFCNIFQIIQINRTQTCWEHTRLFLTVFQGGLIGMGDRMGGGWWVGGWGGGQIVQFCKFMLQ